jgi:hypothetical protein
VSRVDPEAVGLASSWSAMAAKVCSGTLLRPPVLPGIREPLVRALLRPSGFHRIRRAKRDGSEMKPFLAGRYEQTFCTSVLLKGPFFANCALAS